MNIRKMDIADLNPAKYNPRKNLKPGDAEFEKLKRSIETFGYVEPIVVNIKNNNTVISGHQRLNVLKHLGEKEAECVLVELDEKNEKALNSMNKGPWEKNRLQIWLKELKDSDFDVSLTGFDAPEIEELFSNVYSKDVKEDSFDIDSELENGEKPITQEGDLWLLGRHKLYIGDATNPNDMTKLMDGKKANLCVTDPPYNCSYVGGTGMKIKNDNMPDKEFKEFLTKAFKNIYDNTAAGGAFYCFHSDSEKVNFYNATVEAGFHYSTTCIWVKNTHVLSRQDYHMRHEPLIYAFKDTARHKWYGGRKVTSVWEFDRPSRSKIHPTMKSIPLISFPIKNSSLENSIVLDPFGGSGSSLISCEQLNRICYMMEIDLLYATVIIKRFIDHVKTDENIFIIRDGRKIKYKELQNLCN